MQYTFTTNDDLLSDIIVGVSRIVENSSRRQNSPSKAFTHETALQVRRLLVCIDSTAKDNSIRDNQLQDDIIAWLVLADTLEDVAQSIRKSAGG